MFFPKTTLPNNPRDGVVVNAVPNNPPDGEVVNRPVHPPYSSVFVTEFNPEYGNTDLLIWLRKRSSPKYGNGHHLNIFFTVISCVKNVAPSVGNVHVPLYYARCQATRNLP